MPSVCLCLNLHQPFVLRHYSVFDADEQYFDGYRSREVCRRLAVNSVLPTNRILLSLVRHLEGRFRFACCVSGVTLDLFERYGPDVLDSFRELAETGCVEFLGTPHHHGLAFLYSQDAFLREVEGHSDRVAEMFDQRPQTFVNSELVFGDDVADGVSGLGFKGLISDGCAEVLGSRSCGHVYSADPAATAVLLRDERLSRDVAERFADRNWDQWPLTAQRFAAWLAGRESDDAITLVWDYITFGTALGIDTGIFDFLRYLPDKILSEQSTEFLAPAEVIARYHPVGAYAPGRYVSSAEHRYDLSAWLGNALQSHAMHRLFEVEDAVMGSEDPALIRDWRRLQSCEYFRAMDMGLTNDKRCGYLGRMESPYDAYINFMNICDSVAARTSGGPIRNAALQVSVPHEGGLPQGVRP